MIHKTLGRRGVLGGLLGAPIAAKSAVERTTDFRHGAKAVHGSVDVLEGIEDDDLKLTDLNEYLNLALGEYGGHGPDVGSFDPDIFEMRVPMATKVRMQHKRDYERRKQELTKNFWRQMKRRGFARWYL